MSSRIARLRELYERDSSFLISDPINIRYLCGFTGSFGYLLINPNDAVLFTDSRYEIQSRAETVDVSITLGRDLKTFVREQVAAQRVLIEGNHMSVGTFAALEAISDLQFTASHGLVEQLRVIKDKAELAALTRAGETTTSALSALILTKLVGLSERQIATHLDRIMVDLGSDGIGFETIVASGPNSAIPHHHPGDRILSQGDLLKIDFGAALAGYKSDCTRTFVVGEPNDFQRDLHESVRRAQQAGRDAVRNGVVARDIDTAVRTALQDHEFSATFQHGLGHGVGLAIHEDPFLGAKNDTRLASGTVVTIEPGMYVESRGGVRIEDTIVITDDGYINLTDFTYDFISL